MGDTDEAYLVSSDGWLFTGNRSNKDIGMVSSTGINRGLAGIVGRDVYANYQGEDVVGTYRWIPELEAALVSEIGGDEAFAVQEQLTELTLLFSFFAILISVAIGSYLAFSFTNPIEELTDVATQIARV